MTYRLAVLVSHPTQFEAPLYRYLTEQGAFELKVYFWSTDKTTELVDPELGHPPGWDFPLTEGYEYQTLPNQVGALWAQLWGEVFKPGQFDAVLVNGWVGQAACLALIAGSLRGARLIVRSDTTSLYPRPLWKRIVRALALRVLFAKISAFMVTGSLSREHLISLGVSPDSIFLFPYAINNKDFAARCQAYRQQRETLRLALGVERDALVILGVLKFVAREGAMDLVRAYSESRIDKDKTVLLLVGDGKQRPQLEAYAREKQGGKVLFAGYVPYSQLPMYYAVADLFVHPGLREPWGVSVNEAMACGLPVIVSDLVGASRDLVEPGGNGYVFPGGNVGALKHTIERLVRERSRLRAMGERSLEIIRGWDYDLCQREISQAIQFAMTRAGK